MMLWLNFNGFWYQIIFSWDTVNTANHVFPEMFLEKLRHQLACLNYNNIQPVGTCCSLILTHGVPFKYVGGVIQMLSSWAQEIIIQFVNGLWTVCESVCLTEWYTKMKTTKIQRKCLPLHVKAKIIEELSRGCSVTSLAKKYDIAKSTVSSIKNKKLKINDGPTKQCTLKTGEFPKLERKLDQWFISQRERNVPISGYNL